MRIADGTFWLADTNGPSLVHLTADARVLERWLPEGAPLSGAAYSTAEVLPAFLGRGAALESLAATAEGRYLFTMTSRPPAADGGRLVRLLELDTLMARPVGEWAYLLDDPEARLSALAFVDAGRLLAVETTGVSARLFELDLRDATNVLNGPLETAGPGEPRDEAGLEASGVRPVAKSLRVDLAGVPGAEGRIQGVAILNEDTIAVGREEGSALPVLLGGADPSELAAPRLASRLVTLRLDAPLPLGR